MKRRRFAGSLAILLLLAAYTGCGNETEEFAQNAEIPQTDTASSETTVPEIPTEETTPDAHSAKLYAAGQYDEEMQMIGIGWWFADGSRTGAFRILSDGEVLAEVTGEEYWDEEENLFLYMQEFTPVQEMYVFTVDSGTASADVILRRDEDGYYEFEENDSDGDGLSDLDELWAETDPENPDTDGDGFPDGFEYYNGLDPLTPDTDDSGLGKEDHDGDGLTDLEEYRIGTNPYAYDTDKDGFSDGYEVENGMDPLTYDEIVLDDAVLEGLIEYSIEDIECLNLDEYYPLEIDFSDDLTQVTSIMGVYSEITVQTPVDAMYVIYNVKSLVGLDVPEQELCFSQVNHSDSGDSYHFLQYYNGVKVYGRTLTVSLYADGRTAGLHSSVISTDKLKDLNLTPGISEDRLTEIISAEFDTEHFSSELVIDTSDETPRLVYIVYANFNVIHVDADSGEIIGSHSTLID